MRVLAERQPVLDVVILVVQETEKQKRFVRRLASTFSAAGRRVQLREFSQPLATEFSLPRALHAPH